LVFAFGTLIGPFVLSAASALNAANNQAELHRLWMRTTRYTAVLTVPVALITIVLAEPLTRVWIGVAYVHTVPATQLFICYLLYWALLRSGQNMLIGINRLDVLLPSFFLSTTVNLAISVFAAPRLGVAGVILGTVIGNIVTFVLYMRAFQREFGISLNDFVRWIFLSVYPQAGIGALVVAGLVASAYPANLIIIGVYGGIGVLVFGGLFVLTGMPKDERTALQNIIQTRFLARVSEKE
jgi:O-antigen/teichoic acid export membrane protein